MNNAKDQFGWIHMLALIPATSESLRFLNTQLNLLIHELMTLDYGMWELGPLFERLKPSPL